MNPMDSAPLDTPILVYGNWDDPEGSVSTGWAVAEGEKAFGYGSIRWFLCAAGYVSNDGEPKGWLPLPDAAELEPAQAENAVAQRMRNAQRD